MNDVAATRVSGVSAAAAERVSAFLRAVYGWMCVGLGVTAVVAYAITASAAVVQTIASNHLLFLGALAVELGLVFYLSARVQSLAPNAAMLLFLLYSGLNGVTLSVVLLAYTGASIATTFVVTAGMFGVVDFHNQRRALVARYDVDAPSAASAVVSGRQAMLAEYPPARAPGPPSLFERAERVGGQDGSGWIVYRIVKGDG